MPPYLVEQLVRKVDRLTSDVASLKTDLAWIKKIGYLLASSVVGQIATAVWSHFAK